MIDYDAVTRKYGKEISDLIYDHQHAILNIKDKSYEKGFTDAVVEVAEFLVSGQGEFPASIMSNALINLAKKVRKIKPKMKGSK